MSRHETNNNPAKYLNYGRLNVLFLLFILVHLLISKDGLGQKINSIFSGFTMEEVPDNLFGEIHISNDGSVLVSATAFSFIMITADVFTPFSIGLEKEYKIKNIKTNFYVDPMKNITESAEGNIFFTNNNNQITYFKNTETGNCDLPPFYFPIKGDSPGDITKLWFDDEDNLYIGTASGSFYIVAKAGKDQSLNPQKYEISSTKDSNMLIMKGELAVKKIPVAQAGGIFSFAQHHTSKSFVWLGTGNGLYKYNKRTGEVSSVIIPETKITITDIEILANGDIWFSTLEKAMGLYKPLNPKVTFFSYPKLSQSALFPIQSFCIKSPSEFFVAVKDSFPAIFNITDGRYHFIYDPMHHPHFTSSKNSTTDIKISSDGNFYFIKGGLLYSANLTDNAGWIGSSSIKTDTVPLIYQVKDFNNRVIADYYYKPELLKTLKLPSRHNSFIVYYTSSYVSANKRTQFAWKLEGGDIGNWYEMPVVSNNNDSFYIAEFSKLMPGKYLLRVKRRFEKEEWNPNEASMVIIITPPYWATWWFWAVVVVGLSLIIYAVIFFRVRAVRKEEKLRAKYEKELIELEAKALRAQMNPHFVFNCLNSIKALMQENENEKGVTYLTTFSKLIRTLFNNADKKQISLYDEIETCKFYLQLEALRFDKKLSYSVNVNESIDLKSVQVPALIIQPFIENAIWHGIVPRDSGGKVSLDVVKSNGNVEIIIEDDGIGREASQQNKAVRGIAHQSKGVNLAQSRLKLDNLLQQRKAELEIIDKKDENSKATGTKVVIKLDKEI